MSIVAVNTKVAGWVDKAILGALGDHSGAIRLASELGVSLTSVVWALSELGTDLGLDAE